MPVGDYGPDVTLRPVMFNASLDHEGHIAHCGVGYDVLAADGKRVLGQSGHTWHCPSLGIHGHPELVAQMEAVLHATLTSAVAHEGAAGITPPAVVSVPAPL